MFRDKSLIHVLAVLAMLCGCSGDTAGGAVETEPVVSGNTAFAVDLYRMLAKEPGNLFLSPASLSSALAMTYAGARGETANEMARVLHFPDDQANLHAAMAALTKEFNAKSKGFELTVANALWGQKGYNFLEEFLATLKKHYGAGLERVDFVDTENARRKINAWVEARTRNRIKDLLKPGLLTREVMLVLTNAVYFKGLWEVEFDKSHTRDEPFLLSRDNSVTAPMMEVSARFDYLDAQSFQAVRLPYKGDALSMLIFLPREADGLGAFEQSLTAGALQEHVSSLRKQMVVVNLPRFKTTAEFELQDVLAAMGMPRAFSTEADFSGMSGQADLFISAVVHKAFVEVDEKGTEAAAATGVVMRKKAEHPARFRADHPFLFLILDERNGAILFIGRVQNPTG